ncbi:orotate phosphoribosyltransferase [Candidatus Daviesbacteria bacterium RIFCSPLOWO2_01_FULL_39_12]|uniref:Orotate phosphoribosyltransferase n=1 Tax=Candidatus Daviesbacteria bacterium RIFCSPLOWO2_01_FULL_39_12 TaxID=1797785 RepID=A0A1F5KTU4_9BACT|nr:MAG: orotate phosphoribosyltransferase [Candidatus Daviesbacteria bacterium RIFCSPHIGHO2_02_FULL_39_8]OGE44347.1 MAG: orotate phosphoribosyltransferase [Candidatus Daviesbacteria bacterium RIFCSPLOWO2_01_FULL_39_12]
MNTSQKVAKQKENLILLLYKIGAIKFGKFKLKSGKISPYYLDLRFLCSYPSILKQVAKAYFTNLSAIKHDLIAGIPYTGIPIATAISVIFNERMIYTRKEAKNHGTTKMIEGVFKPKERVVLIDDVISDGASKLETIKPLEDEGLVVKDIIVLLDRGQGGPLVMKQKGYKCYCLADIYDIISILKKHQKITSLQVKEAEKFLAK